MAMPEGEQRRAIQSEGFWLKLIAALITLGISGGAALLLDTRSDVDTLMEADFNRRQQIRAITERQDALEQNRKDDREAVIRIEERLEALGASTQRIEAQMSELVRYLRGFRPPKKTEDRR